MPSGAMRFWRRGIYTGPTSGGGGVWKEGRGKIRRRQARKRGEEVGGGGGGEERRGEERSVRGGAATGKRETRNETREFDSQGAKSQPTRGGLPGQAPSGLVRSGQVSSAGRAIPYRTRRTGPSPTLPLSRVSRSPPFARCALALRCPRKLCCAVLLACPILLILGSAAQLDAAALFYYSGQMLPTKIGASFPGPVGNEMTDGAGTVLHVLPGWMAACDAGQCNCHAMRISFSTVWQTR
ncbi:hypothetical protein BO71DRAFT_68825 [Aspergillus ellipticus CBS 707.79]|uniref:Uncharacterized protein n=1 Tax=Aspergillus ellipticus CBS 707.79 TaxID=1448320 RepID=A0A319DRC1_9EURO|nr:hypothetical protein BO71DRAFT_68825 [Aspergillus ellipticus CBS 707.79]